MARYKMLPVKKVYIVSRTGEKKYKGLGVEASPGIILTERGEVYRDESVSFSYGSPEQIAYAKVCRNGCDSFVLETTRNVPEEIKEILSDGAYNVRLSLEAYIEAEQLNKEAEKGRTAIYKIKELIATVNGTLTEDDFIKAFKNELGLAEIWDVSYSSYNNSLRIEHREDIEKYFRSGSFVYEEYDGTMMMCPGCEKDPEYQKYIKRYRRELPIKAKLNERLSLGDKDWLTYYGYYDIPLKEKLTEDYAKTLAKTI